MNDEFTDVFLKGMDREQFCEAETAVRTIASGNIWLMGGSVYRTIAMQLYGVTKPLVDFDFLVDSLQDCAEIPGWKTTRNKYGNPKLVNDALSIDVVPLRNFHSIVRRQLAPTIENFLTGTPLTVQSIVYSFDENKIYGTIGKAAISSKVVAVNDMVQAEHYAARKGIPLHEVILQKAQSLGFSPSFD